jgi:ribosomal protein S18 acetylase RimI-like enzyme
VTEPFSIRAARPEDVERLAILCGQLGYPVAVRALRQRLEVIEESDDHAVFVAATPGGQVIGWVQVCARRLLVAGRLAEIEGLVVDQQYRRRGAGRQLMAQAEGWARSQGCEHLEVRSNVLRPEAPAFYPALGYENYKTSRVYLKTL